MSSSRDAASSDPSTGGPATPDRGGTEDLVRLRVVLTDPDGPAAETLWAAPVAANGGGGRFKVANHAFFVPLVDGDVVEARLDGDSFYQVVGVVEPARVWRVGVLLAASAGRDGARQLREELAAAGGRTEFANPRVCIATSSDESMLSVLERRQADGTVEEWYVEREPGEDVDLTGVNTIVDTTPSTPACTTSYWAADDPFWAAHGLDDPEFLAVVQDMAGRDARVAAALEQGRHDQVLTYLGRVAASARGEQLPPLDGPIFTEE